MKKQPQLRTIDAVSVNIRKQRDSEFCRIDGAEFNLVVATAPVRYIAGAFQNILVAELAGRPFRSRESTGPVIIARIVLDCLQEGVAYSVHPAPPFTFLSA